MQHAACIFPKVADWVVSDDAQEMSSWNDAAIFTNYKVNYAKLTNYQIVEKAVHLVKLIL